MRLKYTMHECEKSHRIGRGFTRDSSLLSGNKGRIISNKLRVIYITGTFAFR